MSTRVTVTVEMTDPTSFSKKEQTQTLTWTDNLFDDNPRYSARELETALAAASTELVARVTQLRGDIRKQETR